MTVGVKWGILEDYSNNSLKFFLFWLFIYFKYLANTRERLASLVLDRENEGEMELYRFFPDSVI